MQIRWDVILIEALFLGGGTVTIVNAIRKGILSDNLWRGGRRLEGPDSVYAAMWLIAIGAGSVVLGVVLLYIWYRGRWLAQ